MFSGIVQGTATIKSISDHDSVRTFGLVSEVGLFDGVKTGASVSVSGVCLTVTKQADGQTYFDVMAETLSRTTLDSVVVGDYVNVERSIRFDDEVGGHVMSGHVIGTAEIVEVRDSVRVFSCPVEWLKCIFQKGFIGIDGCSLTVIDPDREKGTFAVALIPETLQRTTFGVKNVSDKVNIELDAMTQAVVETVERYILSGVMLPSMTEQKKLD